MGSLANFDHGGRYSAYLPAAQGFGQMVGPNISASLLGANLGYSGGLCILCLCYTPNLLIVYGMALSFTPKKAVPRHGRGNLKV